jgi:sporulation protein YlmC with PRC-barrel domain
MRYVLYSSLTALLLVSAATGINAQTAGRTTLGVGTVELDDVIKGWSVDKTLLGKHVYNDKNEQVGKIEDIILSPARKESYAIVSAGGFLGIGSHDVAIPAAQFKMTGERIVLPGATKELIKAMPAFHYARKQ